MKKHVLPLLIGLALCGCTNKREPDPKGDAWAKQQANAIVDSIVKEHKEGRSPEQLLFKTILQKDGVTQVSITDVGILAIAINDNGMDKTPMAKMYLRMAKEYGVDIKGVKLLDASDATFEQGAAYGKELAKEFN